MNPIKLWDIQTGFGGVRPGVPSIPGNNELLETMDRLVIERALARVLPVVADVDFVATNKRLVDGCAASGGRLTPCPVVVPNGAYDLPPESEQVEAAIAAGAGAVWLRPGHDQWVAAEWCADRLLSALAERKLPALFTGADISMTDLARIAGSYPGLRLLFVGMGYRNQRFLMPLMEAFCNICISMGSNYTVMGGIEQICRRVGAGRLLFGTGYPEVDPAASLGALLYADISVEEKQLIGYGNMERLREEIC